MVFLEELFPIIERRMQLKNQRKRKGDLFDLQQTHSSGLVTCFGYTGYKNARFGRIKAHEAICAWAREMYLQPFQLLKMMDGMFCMHS